MVCTEERPPFLEETPALVSGPQVPGVCQRVGSALQGPIPTGLQFSRVGAVLCPLEGPVLGQLCRLAEWDSGLRTLSRETASVSAPRCLSNSAQRTLAEKSLKAKLAYWLYLACPLLPETAGGSGEPLGLSGRGARPRSPAASDQQWEDRLWPSLQTPLPSPDLEENCPRRHPASLTWNHRWPYKPVTVKLKLRMFFKRLHVSS